MKSALTIATLGHDDLAVLIFDVSHAEAVAVLSSLLPGIPNTSHEFSAGLVELVQAIMNAWIRGLSRNDRHRGHAGGIR